MASTTLSSLDDGLRLITLLPEGKFNRDTLGQFADVLDTVLADTASTGIIITGQEKHFSQGLDPDFFDGPTADEVFQFVNSSLLQLARILSCPIPVCAAINGHAFGLGAMIVMACDYAVMREGRGYICLPEVEFKMRLMPAINAFVCARLSPRLLRDVVFAGKKIGAEEAVASGLIDASCAPEQLLQEAAVLMQPMLGKDRTTIEQMKTDVYQTVLDAIDEQSKHSTLQSKEE